MDVEVEEDIGWYHNLIKDNWIPIVGFGYKAYCKFGRGVVDLNFDTSAIEEIELATVEPVRASFSGDKVTLTSGDQTAKPTAPLYGMKVNYSSVPAIILGTADEVLVNEAGLTDSELTIVNLVRSYDPESGIVLSVTKGNQSTISIVTRDNNGLTPKECLHLLQKVEETLSTGGNLDMS